MSKPPNPASFAKNGSEHGEQVAVIVWADQQRARWPELAWLHAIPNGGTRGSDKAADGSSMAARRGAELKAEGVKPGVCDLMLPVARGPYHGLYIEMKKVFNINKDAIDYASPEQLKFIEFVKKQGYAAGVCQGWEQAVGVLEWYMGLGEFGNG